MGCKEKVCVVKTGVLAFIQHASIDELRGEQQHKLNDELSWVLVISRWRTFLSCAD
jgi:hypothetical protein